MGKQKTMRLLRTICQQPRNFPPQRAHTIIHRNGDSGDHNPDVEEDTENGDGDDNACDGGIERPHQVPMLEGL